MFKLIAELIERRRLRRYWRYMNNLMRESGPVVVQAYPVQPPKQK
ncbi:hypothetical protein P3D53_01990 [Pseudomonas aeruginosa]